MKNTLAKLFPLLLLLLLSVSPAFSQGQNKVNLQTQVKGILPFPNGGLGTNVQPNAFQTFGNCTNAAANPSFCNLVEGNLPNTTVFTDQNATFSSVTFDFTNLKIKLPSAAGFVSSAAQQLGLDTTAQNVHVFSNSLDNIFALIPNSAIAGINNNDCAKFIKAGSNLILGTAGSGCGSGGGGSPGGVDTNVQINKTGSFGALAGFGVDNSTTPTLLAVPFSLQIFGPSPWIDVTAFGAKPDAETTATGSMSSGSAVLTISGAAPLFKAADAGKLISVNMAPVQQPATPVLSLATSGGSITCQNTDNLTRGSSVVNVIITETNSHGQGMPSKEAVILCGNNGTTNQITVPSPSALNGATTYSVYDAIGVAYLGSGQELLDPNCTNVAIGTPCVLNSIAGVTTPPPGPNVLITTIQSFTSTTQVTLALTATNTVANATVSWGTDNTSAFTVAIDQCPIFVSGQTARGCEVFVPPLGAYMVQNIGPLSRLGVHLFSPCPPDVGASDCASIWSSSTGYALALGTSLSQSNFGETIEGIGFKDSSGTGNLTGGLELLDMTHAYIHNVSCGLFTNSVEGACITFNTTGTTQTTQYNTIDGLSCVGNTPNNCRKAVDFIGGSATNNWMIHIHSGGAQVGGDTGIDMETNGSVSGGANNSITQSSLETYAIGIHAGDYNHLTISGGVNLENSGVLLNTGVGLSLNQTISNQCLDNTVGPGVDFTNSGMAISNGSGCINTIVEGATTASLGITFIGPGNYSHIDFATQTGGSSRATLNLANLTSFSLPTSVGFTTSATAQLGINSTNGSVHVWVNGTDNFLGTFLSAPGGGKCVQTTGIIGQLVESSSACGSGGGFANPMTAIGQIIGGGTGGTAVAVAAGKTSQLLVATNGATPTFASTGIPGGNGASPVTSTPYTVQCDSGNATIDRSTVITLKSGAGTITVPDPTTSGCGNNLAFVLLDDGAGNLTVNRTTTAVFNIINGSTNLDGQITFSLANGQYAIFNSPDNANYTVRLVATGGTITPSGSLVAGEGVDANSASVIYSSAAYIDCSAPAFTAADDSLRIQNCFAALKTINSQNGVADARGLCGATTWSANPFAATNIPLSGTLLFPICDEHTNVPMVVHGDWNVFGFGGRAFTGQVGSSLIAGASFPITYSTGTITVGTPGAAEVITGSGTGWTSSNIAVGCAFVSPAGGAAADTFGIIQSINSTTSITLNWGANNSTGAPGGSTYQIYCPVLLTGGGGAANAGAQFGMGISHLNFDCNNVAGCVSVMNWYGQQGTYFDHVQAHGFTNVGFDIEWQAQNFGPMTNPVASPGTSCTASTIPFVFRFSVEISRPVIGMSGSKGQCATQINVAAQVDTNNMLFQAPDLENTTVGMEIGGNSACPVGCPMPARTASGVEVSGGGNESGAGTTFIHISNAFFNPIDINIHNTAHTITNMIVDDANGCTITDGDLGQYLLSHTGSIYINTAISTGSCLISDFTGQSGSLGSQTIATTSVAGKYKIKYYLDQNAVCATPGPGQVLATFSWTDGTHARSQATVPLDFASAQSTGLFLQGELPIFSATASAITYTTTYTACTSGTATYDIHVSLEEK